MKIVVLTVAGMLLLELAVFFWACKEYNRTTVTTRDTTDFVAEVQAWLRSETR